MTFLYDIVNLEFVLLFYFLIVSYLRLDVLRSFLFAGHLVTIFLLNDVLFDSFYWGDQYKYLWTASDIREKLLSNEPIFSYLASNDVSRIFIPSLVFAFFPIPFINSVQSIAMINFLLYLVSFFFLKKKGISSNSVDFFYLLYPSFLLYSSLALREILVTLFMILSLYFLLVEEKRLTALIILLPIAIIKFQNFLIFILSYVVYIFFRKKSILSYLIIFVFGLLFIFYGNQIPQINFIIEKINYYRFNLIAEHFGYNYKFMETYNYQPFEIGLSMIPLLAKSFIYMLFKPFPWEATNLVQLIQSLENIFIISFILWAMKKKVYSLIIRQKLVFLNILLVSSMTIYGLVTFNFGTAARFRFPFIVVYLVFYLYLLRSDKTMSSQFSRGYFSTSVIT